MATDFPPSADFTARDFGSSSIELPSSTPVLRKDSSAKEAPAIEGRDSRNRSVTSAPTPGIEATAKKITETTVATPLTPPASQSAGSSFRRMFTVLKRASSKEASGPVGNKVAPEKIKSEMQAHIEGANGQAFPDVIKSMKENGKTDLEISRSLLGTIENKIEEKNYVGKNGETRKQLAAEVLHQLLAESLDKVPPNEKNAATEQGVIVGVAMQTMVHLKEVDGDREKWKNMVNKCLGVTVNTVHYTEKTGQEIEVSVSKKMKNIEISKETKTLLQLANAKFDSSAIADGEVYKKYVRGADENALNLIVLNRPKLTKEELKKIRTENKKDVDFALACEKEIDNQHEIALNAVFYASENYIYAPENPKASVIYKEYTTEAAKQYGNNNALRNEQTRKGIIAKSELRFYARESPNSLQQKVYKEFADINQRNADRTINALREEEAATISKEEKAGMPTEQRTVPTDFSKMNIKKTVDYDTTLKNIYRPHDQGVDDLPEKELLSLTKLYGKSIFKNANNSRDERINNTFKNFISKTINTENERADKSSIDGAISVLDSGLKDPTTSAETEKFLVGLLVDFSANYKKGVNPTADYNMEQLKKVCTENDLTAIYEKHTKPVKPTKPARDTDQGKVLRDELKSRRSDSTEPPIKKPYKPIKPPRLHQKLEAERNSEPTSNTQLPPPSTGINRSKSTG